MQHVRAIYRRLRPRHHFASVEQIGGAACHEGYKSCFFRQVTPEGLKVDRREGVRPGESLRKEIVQ